MSTIKAKTNRPIKNASGTAKALSIYQYNSPLNNFRDDSVLNSNISKGSDISTGFYDKQQNRINKNNMLFYGIDQKIAGQSSTSLLKGTPRIPRVEPDPDYIMFIPVDINEIPVLLSAQSLKDMVKNYSNNVTILADENPCPGGQSNNWIVVGITDPIAIDLWPPCGCYVNTNLGLLDLIPWSKVLKLLRLGADFAEYVFKELVKNDSLFQEFLRRINRWKGVKENIQAAIEDFVDKIRGGNPFARPNLPEGVNPTPLWNKLLGQLGDLESQMSKYKGMLENLPKWREDGVIPLDQFKTDFNFRDEIMAMNGGSGSISWDGLDWDESVMDNMRDYFTGKYPELSPYEIVEKARDFLDRYDIDNLIGFMEDSINRRIANTAEKAAEVHEKLLADLNKVRYEASQNIAKNEALADARKAELKVEADKIAKEADDDTWFWAFWGTLGLALFYVGRKKQCIGAGTVLNEDTCECVCIDPNHEICPATQNAVIDFVGDEILPLSPKPEEMVGCGPKCCGGQAKYQFGGDPCECACLGDITLGTVVGGGGAQDDYWKQGNGCGCSQYNWAKSILTGGLLSSTRGKCVSAFAEERSTALGQQWSGDKCDFICPNTGTTAGQKCGGYARRKKITWTDSQGNTWPNQDSLCECECVQPDDWTGEWPPVCPDEHLWDGSPTVCNCVPCPVKLFYCQEEGTAISCDECPEGFTCSGVEGSDAYICSKRIYVTSSVDSPTYLGSSVGCAQMLGVGAFGNSQWFSGYECSLDNCWDENGPADGCI